MITAAAVNELRQKSGAGIMDCKKALQECNGDTEEASQWLRKKGLAAAAKKSGRVAAEGLVATAITPSAKCGAILELNSETDFVAKNDKFQGLALKLISDYLEFDGDLEKFKTSINKLSNKTVDDEISENVGIIGENMILRRTHRIVMNHGVVVRYLHNQIAPQLGKIGVLVGFETDIDAKKVQDFGRQIAMHIAATKPESLEIANLDQKLVDKERDVISEQCLASGKPPAVIEKMVEGRMAKFYEQVVLLEQVFVVDGQTKIKDVISNFAKENNGHITLKEFVRFTLGEGIEKEKTDLAKEIASINS